MLDKRVKRMLKAKGFRYHVGWNYWRLYNGFFRTKKDAISYKKWRDKTIEFLNFKRKEKGKIESLV